ncbi:HK97 gp10 family phage protein [Clostridium senegalense]
MSDGFDFSELDEFTNQMLEAVNDLKSKETKSFVKKEANKLKTKEKKMYQSMGIGLEPTDTPQGKRIIDKFKSGKPYKFGGDDWSCRAFNSAPHAHLINNGFVHKPHKGSKGKETFVPGWHFIEKASNQFEPEYQADVEEFVGEFIEENGL